MKQATLIAGILLLTTSVHAKFPRQADVTVFVKGGGTVPVSVDQGARSIVTWIYARIGVHLLWRDGEFEAGGEPISCVALQVAYLNVVDGKASRAALAYALPFGGGTAKLIIMYDRVRMVAGEASREQSLLTHVLAHEIGHVLMASDWHSQTGVMKARWDSRDFNDMQRKPLGFTPIDVELILDGLNARRTGARASSDRGLTPLWSSPPMRGD